MSRWSLEKPEWRVMIYNEIKRLEHKKKGSIIDIFVVRQAKRPKSEIAIIWKSRWMNKYN